MESQNQNIKGLTSVYQKAMKQFNLLPNWWMSEEYIDKSGLVRIEEGSLEGFKLPNQSEWFFPPLHCYVVWNKIKRLDFNANIYAGFLSDTTVNGNLLDLQFIYYPKDFVSLKGHKWRVFRKNVRKYPKRQIERYFGSRCMSYRQIEGTRHLNQIKTLLLHWAKGRKLFDNEVMIRFVFTGEHRWGLFVDEELVGMNVWDENFAFINYRYCIDNGTPFLNEYLRYRFYTHPTILLINKPVNDGGCLDSEGLKKFKMKLNPIKIYKVFSYKGDKDANQS